jgi:hypothetical protein
VWYVNVPAGPRLDRLLTDRNGDLHVGSVAAGMVPDELTGEIQCAQMARATSGGRFHPESCRLIW